MSSHTHTKNIYRVCVLKRQMTDVSHCAQRQDCKCIHKGLSQASCQGVHGLQDSDVHNTRPAMHFGKAMDEDEEVSFILCVFWSLNKFLEVSDTLWAQCQVPSLSKVTWCFFDAGRHASVNVERLLVARPGEITPPPEAIDFIPTLYLRCKIPKSKVIQYSKLYIVILIWFDKLIWFWFLVPLELDIDIDIRYFDLILIGGGSGVEFSTSFRDPTEAAASRASLWWPARP